MAAAFHFYQRTLSELNTVLGNYVSDVASKVILAVTPVATQLLTIYFILWGFSIMRGIIQEPLIDGVARLLKICVIYSIAINLGLYNGFLADFLFNTPEQFGAAIAANANGVSNIQFLDSLMAHCYDMGAAFSKAANARTGLIPDLGLLATALLIWAAGLIATAYGAFLLILSKMALSILLGIGPVFVLMLLFEPTKRFFDAWIGQALNFVLLAVLTAAAIKLILTILEKYLVANQAAGLLSAPAINQAVPAIALCAIGYLVMLQLPSIAAALGGGVAINTLGAAGAALRMASKSVAALRPTHLQRSYRQASADARLIGKAAKAPLAIYRHLTRPRERQ